MWFHSVSSDNILMLYPVEIYRLYVCTSSIIYFAPDWLCYVFCCYTFSSVPSWGQLLKILCAFLLLWASCFSSDRSSFSSFLSCWVLSSSSSWATHLSGRLPAGEGQQHDDTVDRAVIFRKGKKNQLLRINKKKRGPIWFIAPKFLIVMFHAWFFFSCPKQQIAHHFQI